MKPQHFVLKAVYNNDPAELSNILAHILPKVRLLSQEAKKKNIYNIFSKIRSGTKMQLDSK